MNNNFRQIHTNELNCKSKTVINVYTNDYFEDEVYRNRIDESIINARKLKINNK